METYGVVNKLFNILICYIFNMTSYKNHTNVFASVIKLIIYLKYVRLIIFKTFWFRYKFLNYLYIFMLLEIIRMEDIRWP